MNCSPLDARSARTKLSEPRCNFLGGLVGERESENAFGRDVVLLDQMPDPLDEAKRLPRAGTSENQQWTQLALYRAPLRWRSGMTRRSGHVFVALACYIENCHAGKLAGGSDNAI